MIGTCFMKGLSNSLGNCGKDKIINVSLGLKLPAGDISYENVSAVEYATIIYVK